MKDNDAVTVMANVGVLMKPVQLGALDLKHRVIMASLTRSRATWLGLIPNDLMALYYEQRYGRRSDRQRSDQHLSTGDWLVWHSWHVFG